MRVKIKATVFSYRFPIQIARDRPGRFSTKRGVRRQTDIDEMVNG